MSVCIWGEAVMIGNGLMRPESCFPIWVYHCLPYFSQWRRRPLVFLVWSTILYQASDLGQTFGRVAFTKHYHRDGGLGRDPHIVSGGPHLASWCIVIRVDNVENRENTRCGLNGGGRYRKENFEIIRPVGL